MSLGRLGSYEILERIGGGGMSVVFRARDARMERTIALKVLREELAQDPAHRDRLYREARALAALSHPNVATCFDCGEARLEPPDLANPGSPGPHPEQVHYLAEEYVPGEDLGATLEGRPLRIDKVIDLAIQIASGLDAAHRANVIHRDLKPGNIRVTPEGQVKILDFGLARSRAGGSGPGRISTASTSEGTVLGTVCYMSPEQAQGQKVDARSDLFSFGVVLYELVTGRRPFEGRDTVEMLYAIANEEPQPLARYASTVPLELERIVSKLIAKSPEDRYQSAHEVLTDLQRLKAGTSSIRPQPPFPAPHGRKWVLVGAAAFVLATAAVVWQVARPAWSGGHRVAVMNFQNLTGDAAVDFLGAGLASDLLNELVQRTNLVLASGALRDERGRPQLDPKAVARELGVGRVVTGMILKTGPEELRLNLQVVDGRWGQVRWAGGFDFTLGNAYQMRWSLVEQVAVRLSGRPARRPRAAQEERQPPGEAYEDYLGGLGQLADADDPLARDRALASFDQAVARDSGFALAWAGRALALSWLYQRDHDPAQMVRAGEAAARAVSLGPQLVQARRARARVYRETGRTREAIAELQQVLAVNPNYDAAHMELAHAYRKLGDFERAGVSFRRAVDLRPGSWQNWLRLGSFLFARADYPGARAAYEEVIRLAPGQNRGYEGLGEVHLATGHYEDALAIYRRLPRPVTDATAASNIATAYFFLGKMEEARRYYLQALSLEPGNPLLRQNLGDCYGRMGRPEEARAQYREAARLTRAALDVEADNLRLRVQLIVNQAKAGDCDSASAQLAIFRPHVPDKDAEILHELAKAYALCGRPREAVATLRQMIRLGSPPDMIRSEDEFRSLRKDPEFQKLVAGSTR